MFSRPKDFSAGDAIPDAPWEAGGDDVMARVHFDPEVAWWARRQLTAAAQVVEGEDGSIDATLPVANRGAFIGWLLAFDDHAVVLEPPELRRELLERVGSR